MSQTNRLLVTSLSRIENGKALTDNLSFEIPFPSKVALVGLNGAGKSSLIRLLVGIDKPTSGNLQINEYFPRDLNLKNCLGYQASGMAALPHLTGREYLTLCCQTKRSLNQEPSIHIAKSIEMWHLADIIDRPMMQLSQGNLQKICIAQAFLGQPDFIFLDEPTQALDPVEQQRFSDNLRALQEYQLCLFSSHHINQAVEMADRVILLNHGKLIALLNLREPNEYWLLSQLSLAEMQRIFTNQTLEVSYRPNNLGLFKINSIGSEEWTLLSGQISQRDTSAVVLGSAANALMPLFTLLANEAL